MCSIGLRKWRDAREFFDFQQSRVTRIKLFEGFAETSSETKWWSLKPSNCTLPDADFFFMENEMKKTISKAILSLASVALLSSSAYAATDGTVGTTSTGTALIQVVIPKLIRARSFADFTTASYPGTGDINQNDDLNVSKNYTGTYKVKATASGGAFTLTDGSQTIAYAPYFNDQTGVTGRVAMTYNTDVTGQTGSATTLGASTLNANLSVEILEADLQAVNAGTYSSTISLVFAPE